MKIRTILYWILLIVTGMWIVRYVCRQIDNYTKDEIMSLVSTEEYEVWLSRYYGMTDVFDYHTNIFKG